MSFYPNSYPEDIIDTDYTDTVSSGGAIRPLFAPSRHSIGSLQKEAMFFAMKEHCRAMLAKTALEQTAALAMMEQQAAAMTPENAGAFHEIVKAYAAGAANQLRRW